MEHEGFPDNRAHYSAYTVFIVCFMCLGTLTYGFSAANIGITLGQPSFLVYMHLDTNPHTPALEGAFNGLWYTGGFCGSICHGWVANRYGRKASIALGALLVIVSGAILTGSVNPAMFIVFRFFNGWGCFELIAGVPLWVTEIVPPKNRGMLGDLAGCGTSIGYVVSAYVGVGFYYTNWKEAWRPPIALQVVPPLVLLAGIYWIPESPRWLLSKDRVDDAWKIIRRLHTDKKDTTDEFAQREFYQMRKQIQFERTLKTSYIDIFRKPSLRKRAFMTMLLTFFMFSSGVLVINAYGSLIYTSLGYDTADSLQFQAGYVGLGLIFNFVGITFVDRVRRNRLLAFGFFCICSCLIAETILQRFYIGTENIAGLGACIAVIYAFVISYSMLLDGPTYFYIAELWPTYLRAQGYTLGMSSLAVTNIIWLEAAPTAFATIGWKYYLFFIIITAIACATALLWFPNTLHKPLEEIAAMFGEDDMVVLFQKNLTKDEIGADTLGDFEKNPEQVESKHVETMV